MVLFVLCFYMISTVQGIGQLNYITNPLTAVTRYVAYSPNIISKVCRLKPEVGPCRGNIKMYFFDPEKFECDTFRWGGCQGNGNRFDSRSECNRTCLSTIHTPRTRPAYCHLVFDYGFCFGTESRWYYDRLWKVCKKTIYSGCGGNQNNFLNQEQCDNVCRFAKGFLRKASTRNMRGSRKVIVINPENTTSTDVTPTGSMRTT